MKERIEDIMFPENNTFQELNDGTICSMIVDVEMDPVFLQFHNDGCVYVDCENLTHIYLTRSNLKEMRSLLDKAERQYAKRAKLKNK